MASKNKEAKIPLHSEDVDLKENLQKSLQAANHCMEKATSTEEKLAAAQAVDDAKSAIKGVSFIYF